MSDSNMIQLRGVTSTVVSRQVLRALVAPGDS